jgi:ribonuclease R
VPVSTLGDEYVRSDEGAQALEGEQSGTRFTPGLRLKLRLAEADPIGGALRFELPRDGESAKPRQPGRDRRAPGKRGRPGNIRHNGRRR